MLPPNKPPKTPKPSFEENYLIYCDAQVCTQCSKRVGRNHCVYLIYADERGGGGCADRGSDAGAFGSSRPADTGPQRSLCANAQKWQRAA